MEREERDPEQTDSKSGSDSEWTSVEEEKKKDLDTLEVPESSRGLGSKESSYADLKELGSRDQSSEDLGKLSNISNVGEFSENLGKLTDVGDTEGTELVEDISFVEESQESPESPHYHPPTPLHAEEEGDKEGEAESEVDESKPKLDPQTKEEEVAAEPQIPQGPQNVEDLKTSYKKLTLNITNRSVIPRVESTSDIESELEDEENAETHGQAEFDTDEDLQLPPKTGVSPVEPDGIDFDENGTELGTLGASGRFEKPRNPRGSRSLDQTQVPEDAFDLPEWTGCKGTKECRCRYCRQKTCIPINFSEMRCVVL